MLMVHFAMQDLLPPLVARILFCISLGLVKVKPRLIASDDICERSIVVFRVPFQQLFWDSYTSKFLFFCNEMGYPSGTYPSQNCMICSY